MTVGSNYAIAIAKLGDWFSNLAPVYQSMRTKTPKPIATCTRDFSRALIKFHRIATNSDWFIALFSPAVIGRSNYYGICFTTVKYLGIVCDSYPTLCLQGHGLAKFLVLGQN